MRKQLDVDLINRMLDGVASQEDLEAYDAVFPHEGDIYLNSTTGRMLLVVKEMDHMPKVRVLAPGTDHRSGKMNVGDEYRTSCLDCKGWERISTTR